MRIGILGSGSVGQALGAALVQQGHEVKIGTRDAKKLDGWLSKAGNNAYVGSFEEAAKFGEVIFLCTLWMGTENAIKMARPANFHGKIVVDVTNPLDFSHSPPRLATKYPVSAAEQVQSWLPGAKVVKAFNTVPAHIMVNPEQLGEADLFVAGSAEGKEFVRSIAKKWGWRDIVDMGGLSEAWWVEMIAMSVISYGFAHNDWNFALRFLRK